MCLSIGRLLYTTGNVAGAVRVFLGLLRGPSKLQHPFNTSSDNLSKWTESDKAYLDDFRVAYAVCIHHLHPFCL